MGHVMRRAAVVAMVFGLLAAACGGGGGAGSGGPYGGGSATSTSPGTAVSPTSGVGTSGSGGSTGSGGASVLTIKQANFQFTPTKITVSQGDAITVSNTNPSTPHTFTIDGTGIDVANVPQQSQDVTIDLAPGSYTFYCRFHRSQGMQGTLVVK